MKARPAPSRSSTASNLTSSGLIPGRKHRSFSTTVERCSRKAPNGRIYDAIKKDKKPFTMVWDSHIYDLDVWSVVKGTKKKDLAMKFVAFATGTKPLSGMPDVAYGPPRKILHRPDRSRRRPRSAHVPPG